MAEWLETAKELGRPIPEPKGRLLNHDNFTVQFLDPQGKLHSYMKADLKESTVLTKGLMPSYKDRLSPQEVADVVAYLATLKGPSGSSR